MSTRSKSKQGAFNPMAKLTPGLVRRIRRLVASHGRRRGYKAALARRYGISQGTLADLVSFRRWGHV